MVRVLHHLPDPDNELAELRAILRPGGHAVIEAANSAHAKRRMTALLHRQRIPPIRSTSAPRRPARGRGSLRQPPPRTIIGQLAAVGLEVRQTLSASNFRHPLAKALVPQRALLAAERALQQPLAGIYFGPSLFCCWRSVPWCRRRPARWTEPLASAATSRCWPPPRHWRLVDLSTRLADGLPT